MSQRRHNSQRPPTPTTPPGDSSGHHPVIPADTFVPTPDTEHPAFSTEPIDPRTLGLHREQPPRDVPYLPTDQHVVNKMLEMAKVGKGDLLYDLGCGDGRIVITAAKLGARGIGVEIDLQRLRECHDNLRNTQLKHMVEFRRQSFFDIDLRPATVVALYLLPAINKLLRPKFLWELKPGTRIVANYFEIADWVPDEQIVFKHRPVMLWIVPAWVQGTWRCLFKTPIGSFHLTLTLSRNIQFVSGHAVWAGRKVPLTGRIRGYTLSLTLPETPGAKTPTTVEAIYHEGEGLNTPATLRGIFTPSKTATGQPGLFSAYRL